MGYVAEPYPDQEQYEGCLSIPYLAGPTLDTLEPVSLRFRRFDGNGPKYLSMDNDECRLFNVSVLLDPPSVCFLCEGEFDAILAQHVSSVPAVALPGASTFAPAHRRLLSEVERIIVVGDGDDAGRRFNYQMKKELENVRVWEAPPGEDITSLFKIFGIDWLRSWLTNAYQGPGAT